MLALYILNLQATSLFMGKITFMKINELFLNPLQRNFNNIVFDESSFSVSQPLTTEPHSHKWLETTQVGMPSTLTTLSILIYDICLAAPADWFIAQFSTEVTIAWGPL